MDYETILYQVSHDILTVTLNRPAKLNAFTRQMMLELIDAIDRADADDDVRAIIITGAGRAFCAGADLSDGAAVFDFAKGDGVRDPGGPVQSTGEVDWSHAAVRDTAGQVTLRMFDCLKPIIAAINGPAVGAGATMPLAMDIRLASRNARFGYVFSRRGIVPEACSSWFLPRLVGISRALEWALSGRIFAAEEALAGGLVRSLHEPDELMPAATAIAREMVDNCAPVSIAMIRQMYWKMLGADHPMEAHKVDSKGVFARGRSSDATEGVVSFLEKRSPRFVDPVSSGMPPFFPWWKPRGYS